MVRRFFASAMIFFVLVNTIYVSTAHAQAAALRPFTGALNRAVAGAITNAAVRRGFAANDPRIAATLTAVSTAIDIGVTVGGPALLVSGGRAWGTAALAIGATAGLAFGAYKLYEVVTTDPDTGAQVDAVKVVDVTKPVEAQNAEPVGFTFAEVVTKPAAAVSTTWVEGSPTLTFYRNPTCNVVLDSACGTYPAAPNSVYWWPITTHGGVPINSVADVLYATALNDCGAVSGCYSQVVGSVSVDEEGYMDLIVRTVRPDGSYTSDDWSLSPRRDTGGGLGAYYGRDLGDALAQINPDALDYALPNDVIADLATEAMLDAAALPDYAGLPVSVTDAVTATDVSTWKQDNPATSLTAVELLTTPYHPDTGTIVINQTVTDADPGTAPQPGTGTENVNVVNTPNVNVVNTPNVHVTNTVSVDFGQDPGVGMPSLDGTPTAASILDPIFNLFPSLQSYTVPNHTGVCPTGQLSLFGETQSLSAHCDILEDVRPIVAAMMAFLWAFAALRISLSA